jgi:hypothetical protein
VWSAQIPDNTVKADTLITKWSNIKREDDHFKERTCKKDFSSVG